MAITKKSRVKTAVVIGGGIVGLSCAINLAKRGIATTLVDPNTQRRGASWGNAGHIAIEQVEPLASLATVKTAWQRLFWRGGALALPLRDIAAWLPFAVRMLLAARPRRFAAGKTALASALAAALPAWRRLLNDAGARELLKEDGHFVVWETARSAKLGRAKWDQMDTGSVRFRDATASEIAMIASVMGSAPAGAIRFLGSGQISELGVLADVLERQFEVMGGVRRNAMAKQLDVKGDKALVNLETGEVLDADAVVIAAGAASAPLLAPIKCKTPLIAERGYHIQSVLTHSPATMPPIVFEDRSMIVTRFASGMRAASFVEFCKLGSAPDRRKWERLRTHVSALGLPFTMPGTEWAGARPTLPDYLPAVGRSRLVRNVYYAFGHQHLGLTLGPMTGEAIAALVSGDPLDVDITPFDLERFGRK